MTRTFTIWLLLAGLLLQTATGLLPAQRAEAIERLAHKVLHGLDRGDHAADHQGHEVDASLALASDQAQPGHSHANEGVQMQGLPVVLADVLPSLPAVAPPAASPLPPPRVTLDGLLRPPRSTA